MNKNYTLNIESRSHGNLHLRLFKRGEGEDRISPEPAGRVYSDELYKLCIKDGFHQLIYIQECLISNERVSIGEFIRESAFFRDSFGSVRFLFRIDDEEYVTEKLTVMIRETEINRNILNMVNYIYDNFGGYLMKNGSAGSLYEGRIELMREIAEAYFAGYGFFSVGAARMLCENDVEAEFERLDSIYPSTIRYIVTHPEKLMPVEYSTGIVFGRQNYQPATAVLRSAGYSYDTYENRVVVGFLATLIRAADSIAAGMMTRAEGREYRSRSDGYIDSRVYVYSNSINRLERMLDEVRRLIDRLWVLYREYSQMLHTEDVIVEELPMPTEVFITEGSYREIYRYMEKWFSEEKQDNAQTRLMQSFDSTAVIYEYYCLFKMIHSLTELGFETVDEYAFCYPDDHDSRTAELNNTFVFQRGGCRLTLYYQPVISTSLDPEEKNGIGLYRSTSISIPSNIGFLNQEIYHGSFYTPDYIIKVEDRETEYFILDAKHRKKEDVINYELKNLIFKYLFSVSAVDPREHIGGLCILNGKSSENEALNIHDVSEGGGRMVRPHAYVVTLSGNDTADNDVIKDYLKGIINMAGDAAEPMPMTV